MLSTSASPFVCMLMQMSVSPVICVLVRSADNTNPHNRYIAAPYKPRIKHNRVYASCYFNTMEDPGADAVNECLAVMAVSRCGVWCGVWGAECRV